MRIEFENNLFIFRGDFEERHVPKNAGFWWEPSKKIWFTPKKSVAHKLYGRDDVYWTDEAREAIQDYLEFLRAQQQKQEASRATDAELELNGVVPSGLSLYGFQKAGVKFFVDYIFGKQKGLLLADEMGLGKTVQAIAIVNACNFARVLVVCPNSLKFNWRAEMERWLVEKREVVVLNGSAFDQTQEKFCWIVNFEQLKKHWDKFTTINFDLLIVDEAHYIKNREAQRTQLVLKLAKQANYCLFLTGTPILNRPVELFPMLTVLDPNGLGVDFWYFAKRYCNAKRTRWGWDFGGASNAGELNQKLRERFMVRRLKKEVLTELPPKIRQILYLQVDQDAKELVLEHELEVAEIATLLQKLSELEGASDRMEEFKDCQARLRVRFENLSKKRQALGLAKVNATVEFLLDFEEPVVVFTYHTAVAAKIVEALRKQGKAVGLIAGEVDANDRQVVVENFQAGKLDFVVCTLKAAGVGLTLTRANKAVFVELDWTPAVIEQAEDRLHRIGQEDNVHVFYLVYRNSLDALLAENLVEKKDIINKFLN